MKELEEFKLASVPKTISKEEQEFQEDFILVRKNMLEITKKAAAALDICVSIVEDAESGSMFESAASLIKATIAANESLMSIHERKRMLAPADEPEPETKEGEIVDGK